MPYFDQLHIHVATSRIIGPLADIRSGSLPTYEDAIGLLVSEVDFILAGAVITSQRINTFLFAAELQSQASLLASSDKISIEIGEGFYITGIPMGELLDIHIEYAGQTESYASWFCTRTDFLSFTNDMLAELANSAAKAGADLWQLLAQFPPFGVMDTHAQ